MKRLLIATALICSTALSAHADQMVYRWYDTIRHNGHKRPGAIGNANTAKCDAEYGQAFSGLPPGYTECMERLGYRLISAQQVPAPRLTVTYNRDSRDPNIGWHSEGGMRVCHNDCDNPEIPGSGAVCKDVEFMGTTMRECVTH
jgi:hypothetical protein